jgi:hypothetical protein
MENKLLNYWIIELLNKISVCEEGKGRVVVSSPSTVVDVFSNHI